MSLAGAVVGRDSRLEIGRLYFKVNRNYSSSAWPVLTAACILQYSTAGKI